jgi:hypothetical protein
VCPHRSLLSAEPEAPKFQNSKPTKTSRLTTENKRPCLEAREIRESLSQQAGLQVDVKPLEEGLDADSLIFEVRWRAAAVFHALRHRLTQDDLAAVFQSYLENANGRRIPL